MISLEDADDPTTDPDGELDMEEIQDVVAKWGAEHPPVKISQSTFTHLECGHRPSQALNSADRIPAPLN